MISELPGVTRRRFSICLLTYGKGTHLTGDCRHVVFCSVVSISQNNSKHASSLRFCRVSLDDRSPTLYWPHVSMLKSHRSTAASFSLRCHLFTGKCPGFRAPSEFEASAGEAEQGTPAAARGKIGHFMEAWWPRSLGNPPAESSSRIEEIS